jgi:hypothetical protein
MTASHGALSVDDAGLELHAARREIGTILAGR